MAVAIVRVWSQVHQRHPRETMHSTRLSGTPMDVPNLPHNPIHLPCLMSGPPILSPDLETVTTVHQTRIFDHHDDRDFQDCFQDFRRLILIHRHLTP